MRLPNPFDVARRRLDREGGFTIIELMVALSVFAVLMTAVAAGISTSLTVTRTNRQRSVAANLAAQEMDSIRSVAFADLPVGQVTSNQIVDGIPYTIKRDSEWVTKNATSTACDGVSGSALAYLRVTVAVSWNNMRGTRPVTTQTVVTPPVGAFDPNTGHIAVRVLDRGAGPQAGVPLTVTNPVGAQTTQASTSEGCAFFAYLAPGTYTVSANSLGFVDGQGTPTPSQNASVSVGGVTSVQFDYDRAATLALALVGVNGAPPADGLEVTLANTKLLPVGTNIVAGQLGASRTVGNLFPYVDGYQAWGGACADADPEGQNSDGTGPYYPGATRDPALSTTPGDTTAGTITLPEVRVRVRNGSGNDVAGAAVSAVHAPDNACPSGKTIALGTTDGSGRVQVAIPFGQWEFRVGGRSPLGGTWPTQIVAPPANRYDVDVGVQ